MNEGLKEVVALGFVKSAAVGTFPTESERALDLYDEVPPIWYPDRPQHKRAGVRSRRKWYKGVENLFRDSANSARAFWRTLNIGSHTFCEQQN
jgi:hypothetical protein